MDQKLFAEFEQYANTNSSGLQQVVAPPPNGVQAPPPMSVNPSVPQGTDIDMGGSVAPDMSGGVAADMVNASNTVSAAVDQMSQMNLNEGRANVMRPPDISFMAQQPQQVRESEDQINTNVTRPNNQGVIPT